MELEDLTKLEITVEPSDVDEHQFSSVWNIASATMGGDATQARFLASKFLGFMCKHRFNFVIASPTDAKYLDEWFERDTSLLYNWKPESESVDVVAQHAYVPFDTFVSFLKTKKFQADKNYSPRRADRVEWFTEDWNVG